MTDLKRVTVAMVGAFLAGVLLISGLAASAPGLVPVLAVFMLWNARPMPTFDAELSAWLQGT